MASKRNRFAVLDIGDLPKVKRTRKPRPRYAIKLVKKGVTVSIALSRGQNSFGEPDVFAGKRPAGGRKEFRGLRGQPCYAIQQWAVSNGYTYEVT